MKNILYTIIIIGFLFSSCTLPNEETIYDTEDVNQNQETLDNENSSQINTQDNKTEESNPDENDEKVDDEIIIEKDSSSDNNPTKKKENNVNEENNVEKQKTKEEVLKEFIAENGYTISSEDFEQLKIILDIEGLSNSELDYLLELDIYKLMTLFHQLNKERRENSRIESIEKQEEQKEAIQEAAKKMREAAAVELNRKIQEKLKEMENKILDMMSNFV